MKKLNIFTQMKRTSRGDLSGQISPNPSAPTDTLGRIVNAKEEAQRKWVEEQEEFARRRKEHEIKMIEMEQAEAQRREVEVRKLGEDLVEIRRKNRVIQDKVKEQIDVLQRKLEEYKIEHKAQEESLEDEIVAKEDLITSVKQSIEFRMKGIELDTSETKLSEEESKKNLYPTMPSSDTFTPKSPSSNVWNSKLLQSSHKSPLMARSLDYPDSSRSDTPRTDSSEGDNTSM